MGVKFYSLKVYKMTNYDKTKRGLIILIFVGLFEFFWAFWVLNFNLKSVGSKSNKFRNEITNERVYYSVNYSIEIKFYLQPILYKTLKKS